MVPLAKEMCIRDRYEALAVPSLGANVLKLTCRHPCGKQIDILRTPSCAQALLNDPYAYGIPVLFPANRIAGGEYSYDGVTYRFPQNYPCLLYTSRCV